MMIIPTATATETIRLICLYADMDVCVCVCVYAWDCEFQGGYIRLPRCPRNSRQGIVSERR
jgi:hypothetical protein